MLEKGRIEVDETQNRAEQMKKEIETAELRKVKIRSMMVVSCEEDLKVFVREHFAFAEDQIQIAFDQWFAAHTLDEYELEFPADWWQGVRERFLPGWWLKLNPVRKAKVKVDTFALYPTIPWPDKPAVICTDVSEVEEEVEEDE